MGGLVRLFFWRNGHRVPLMKPILPTRHAALFTALAGLMVTSACGPADTDPGEGGVTVGEARALDEAAEMVEAGRLDPAVVGKPPEPAVGDQPPENRQSQPEEPAP